MTFYELMYGFAFIAPLLCALVEGRNAGFIGVLVALAVGPALGVCGFLLTRGLFRWVRRHAELGKDKPEGIWMLLVWLLCVGMVAGVGSICFVGIATTKFIASYVAG